MSKLAKNYLPIMFNIYTLEMSLAKDPVRQSLHDTIKCYLQVTNPDLLNIYLLQAVRNFENYSKMCQESSKNKTQETSHGESGKKVKFDFKSMEATTAKNEDKALVDSKAFAKHAFLDLVILLVKYADHQNIQVVYELATSAISVREAKKESLMTTRLFWLF